MTDKTKKRTKVSDARQKLIARANDAGLTDEIDWKWPEDAIASMIAQAEDAQAARAEAAETLKAAKEKAARSRRARDSKAQFLKLTKGGKITSAIHDIIDDPASIPEKNSPQPQTRACTRKVIAILYAAGHLTPEFTKRVEKSFADASE